MKEYVTGFISGGCLIASALLFMGANKGDVIKTSEIQVYDKETGKLALHLFANAGSGGLVINRTDDKKKYIQGRFRMWNQWWLGRHLQFEK